MNTHVWCMPKNRTPHLKEILIYLFLHLSTAVINTARWKTSCHAFLAKNSKLSTDPQFEIRKQDLQRTRIVWADLLMPETKYYCILCYMRDISDCFPILLRGNTQLKLAWRWEEHLQIRLARDKRLINKTLSCQ